MHNQNSKLVDSECVPMILQVLLAARIYPSSLHEGQICNDGGALVGASRSRRHINRSCKLISTQPRLHFYGQILPVQGRFEHTNTACLYVSSSTTLPPTFRRCKKQRIHNKCMIYDAVLGVELDMNLHKRGSIRIRPQETSQDANLAQKGCPAQPRYLLSVDFTHV